MIKWDMILPEEKTAKNVFLEIFNQHWDEFKSLYPNYSEKRFDEVIQSIVKCGDPEFGFKQYQCFNCGKDSRIVSFSCKSPLCLTCGRTRGEKYSSKIKSRLHPDVKYRHVSLTIPEQFRWIFYRNRKETKYFNRFFQAGWECIQDFIAEALKMKVECGCLMVIHTVGRNCQYNPHLHVLIMAGGIDPETSSWVSLENFDYDIIHQSWKKTLLKMFKEIDVSDEYEELIEFVDKKYSKGFVANIKAGYLPKNARHLIRYISKYLCRPQMSIRRIKNYCKEKKSVEIEYRSHKSKKVEREKMSVIDFIGRMVQQIMPKGFQNIRYFGLQASKNQERLNYLVSKSVGNLNLPTNKEDRICRREKPPVYRDLIKIWWNKDPFRCSSCDSQMELSRIWIPGKGFVFSIFRRLFGEDLGPPGNLPDFCYQHG